MNAPSTTLHIVEVLRAFQGSFPMNLKLMRELYGLRSLEVMPEASSPFHLVHEGKPLPVHLPCDAVIGVHAFLMKSWDEGKPKFLMQFAQGLTDGAVLVDVGANVGLFSRQCLSLMPNLREVHCYEPHPGNHEMLQRNLGMLPHAHLVNLGLSTESGAISFYEDPSNVGNYSLNLKAMPPVYRESKVEVVNAATQEDRWLASGRPIFYKSDTQGHDELIATALSDHFWSQVKVGFFELWRLEGKTFDRARFARILDGFPYKVFEKAPTVNVTTAEVMTYLEGVDGAFDDLLFWR